MIKERILHKFYRLVPARGWGFGICGGVRLVGFMALLAGVSACASAGQGSKKEDAIHAAPQTASDKDCKPTYTQIYQPPLKLGGSGRIIQIKTGVSCG